MDSVIMKLSGTLDERHRCFNALVHEAYQKNTSLSVPNLEEAALDRLFKIDLASKQRNVDFIIHTLKDDDLLYVNRALKSKWLLEPQYSNIIEPTFMETELFPDMTLPAVNKMRHWIQMHLRDPQRCKQFHQFYKQLDADIAVKFLWHCSNEYVVGEISDALDKITPKLLKRLSEKVPRITKIYYDTLRHNETLLKYYVANDSKFFANIKYLLKTDANIFFHIIENFFDPQKFRSFSPATTVYIMKQHKNRFLWKPELYTAWFLDVATLARHLSSEEIKDLVLKLARAEYLNSWFSYKTVEPLIKRINKEERDAFKTLVFVDNAFGPTVKEWPYPVSAPPVLPVPQVDLFDDIPMDRNDDDEYDDANYRKKKPKTLLDELFDKYRFFTYEQTFLEIRKQVKAESSAENRMFMLLVLVSKTGGRTENVVSLLDLLWQHRNEPVHIRAAIVRSLVKRACVWRLPVEHWTKLLEWGHGLGLDGSPSQANCKEGLHAVVMRDLLAGVKPSEAVWKTFLTHFNTMHEYPLTADERRCVRARLPDLILTTIVPQADHFHIIQLNRLLDTLKAYHVRYEDFPGVVEAVVSAFKHKYNWPWFKNSDKDKLLMRLYDGGVAKKRLIREYFEIRQADESYVNALRHDITVLDNMEKLGKLIDERRLKHDKFFRKLALYFMEEGGLGEKYCAVLTGRAADSENSKVPFTRIRRSGQRYFLKGRQILAMPLAALSGPKFISLLQTLDKGPPKTSHRQIAAALRSNAHIVRPPFYLESFGWRKAGVKAVSNRVATCRQRDVERFLQECQIWRRTLRLALLPAKRLHKEREAFQVLASRRPGTALRAALLHFRRERDSSDLHIWEMVKSHILKADFHRCLFFIDFTKSVPGVIKAEYCSLVYMVSKQYTKYLQCKAFLKFSSVLAQLNEENILDTIDGFLCEYFTDCDVTDSNADFYSKDAQKQLNKRCIILYIEIIAKFLVLSTSEQMLEEKYRKVALPLLNRLELFWTSPKDVPTEQLFDAFLFYLRYNRVYFDIKYVSCLPVFEKIAEWIHGFLPLEKWFEKHVIINLTTIYFKAIRHCLSHNPELFSESNRKPERSYMLGTFFGNLVSNETEDLTKKYFPSITELYGSEFVNYFNEYIYRKNDECFNRFTVAVMDALVTNKSVASCVLAKYLFSEFEDRLKTNYSMTIVNQFNESGVKELRVETSLPVFTGWREWRVRPSVFASCTSIHPVHPKRPPRRRGGRPPKHYSAYY